MRISFVYLGLEVGGNSWKKQLWEPVVNKISARLNAWKGRFLSLGGRICLIKSIFSAIPLFYFSFFKALTSVCNRIIGFGGKSKHRYPGSVGRMYANLWREVGWGLKILNRLIVFSWQNGSGG